MPDFKSTFIPKRPVVEPQKASKRHVVNPISLVGWILFFGALAVLGGFYLYQVLLERKIESKFEEIRFSIEEIGPELVETLKRADTQLKTVETLLDNHVAVSPLFDFLEKSTLVTVRFEKIELEVTPGEGATVGLPGEARDYNSVALQSRVFSEGGLPEALFSDFTLNEKGNVGFSFESDVAKNGVSYKTGLGIEDFFEDAGQPPE